MQRNDNLTLEEQKKLVDYIYEKNLKTTMKALLYSIPIVLLIVAIVFVSIYIFVR